MKLNRTPFLPSEKKLRELALYISERSEGDLAFGATKLNKLLFYSDFLAYLNFGKSITGQKYFRLNNGPAPIRWQVVRDKMISHGELAIKKQEFWGFPQTRPIPLRKSDISFLSESEKKIVDEVIDRYATYSASQISDESHGFIGWSLAGDKEEIPYQTALIFRTTLTDSVAKHAALLAESLRASA